MIRLPLLAIFLIQASLALMEESYPDEVDAYPHDLLDTSNDMEIERSHMRPDNSNYDDPRTIKKPRSSSFIRYGRGNEDFARPTKPEGLWKKNDIICRRARTDGYLRFGREPQSHNPYRFGRSVADVEEAKDRSKREASSSDESWKRGDSFMRFGKRQSSPYYQRYASDPVSRQLYYDLARMRQLEEPAVMHFLMQLISHKQDKAV